MKKTKKRSEMAHLKNITNKHSAFDEEWRLVECFLLNEVLFLMAFCLKIRDKNPWSLNMSKLKSFRRHRRRFFVKALSFRSVADLIWLLWPLYYEMFSYWLKLNHVTSNVQSKCFLCFCSRFWLRWRRESPLGQLGHRHEDRLHLQVHDHDGRSKALGRGKTRPGKVLSTYKVNTLIWTKICDLHTVGWGEGPRALVIPIKATRVWSGVNKLGL